MVAPMKMQRRSMWVRALAVAAVLVGSACGESREGLGECWLTAACGGDPTGTWRAVSLCPAGDSSATWDLPPPCRSGVAISNTDVDMTLSIGSDGGLTEDGTVSIDWDFGFDSACIEAAVGAPLTTDSVTEFCLAEPLATAHEELTGASCQQAGLSCTCEAVLRSEVADRSRVEVDGTDLVFPDGVRKAFCVSDGELRVFSEMAGVTMQVLYERVN